MTKFANNYHVHENEKKWQQFWQEHRTYAWDPNESKDNSFIVDTPPPTVSGHLHIGHVYSYTQTDFIMRFQRMIGKNVFYPMGFDDNGLPTERLVEKQKKVRAANMEREQFIALCQSVVHDAEEKFRTLFNHIALSVDWSLEYQTVSPLSRKISQMSFLDLAHKGEVYRNEQPILWDCVDQTALSQADIEDIERTSHMNHIIFYTKEGEKLTIATTRPEMLPACVAVFYHPEDERYKHLANKSAITPLLNVAVPLLPDPLVQMDKGSGLVMCCTFGDQTDIIWWKTHKLPLKIIINKKGIIEFDHDKVQIGGLKVEDARDKIINILKEAQLLVHQVEINHTIKCSERSGVPLEILTAPQWFVHTIAHKDQLLKRADELNWHPKNMKIRLENWIRSVSWDWCISRQRYFGVPFPVWYSKRIGEEGKILFADATQLPVDPLKDLPLGYNRDEVDPDCDVMDTWATSAVSPQLSSHGISENLAIDAERHAKLFPADLRPQAHEIIRTWAFYTILKSHLHQNTLPWTNIMISGWCLAENRAKMSKSKGNVIVPETLLAQYGADVVRYWAANSKLGADSAYSEDVTRNGKRLVNKLWNAAKFVSIHFDKLEEQDKNFHDHYMHPISHTLDQWAINKLAELVAQATLEMENYEYASALYLIEKFFWKILCDNYLEIIKTRIYNASDDDHKGQYSAIFTLYHMMQVLLKLFAPFMPHITEEIYHILYSQDSIHTKGNWPKYGKVPFVTESATADSLIEILDLVRKAKAENNLSVKAPIKLLEIKGVTLPDDLMADLRNVTSAESIKFVQEFSVISQKLESADIKINVMYPET